MELDPVNFFLFLAVVRSQEHIRIEFDSSEEQGTDRPLLIDREVSSSDEV